jgi:hypothetical protein
MSSAPMMPNTTPCAIRPNRPSAMTALRTVGDISPILSSLVKSALTPS